MVIGLERFLFIVFRDFSDPLEFMLVVVWVVLAICLELILVTYFVD